MQFLFYADSSENSFLSVKFLQWIRLSRESKSFFVLFSVSLSRFNAKKNYFQCWRVDVCALFHLDFHHFLRQNISHYFDSFCLCQTVDDFSTRFSISVLFAGAKNEKWYFDVVVVGVDGWVRMAYMHVFTSFCAKMCIRIMSFTFGLFSTETLKNIHFTWCKQKANPFRRHRDGQIKWQTEKAKEENKCVTTRQMYHFSNFRIFDKERKKKTQNFWSTNEFCCVKWVFQKVF